MAKEHIDYGVKVVEMRNIVKKFGDFTANDGINLTVHKGEIHAILGENGAGKSTLMNQLYGLYKPTSGDIIINGKKLDMSTPRDAIAAGIGMVHQHFMLIQPFTVTENIVLGTEPRKGIVLDMATARKNVVEISQRYGLAIDPDAKIEDISVGMQQRVEILKALYRGADVLILDEPTASLTPQEIVELIDIMHNLTSDGKSIILITHKLKEIKASADYCTIIRLGKYIDTVDVETVSEDQLASMMVGRQVTFQVDKPEQPAGDVVLEVKDLHGVDYRGVEILRGLNLTVRKGEIVGIAGIDGNGQTELVEIITGLKKATKGQITINGVDIFNKPPRFGFVNGVSSIPADRQKHGLVLDFTVEENLVLQNYREPEFSKKGLLNRDAIHKFADECVGKYDIRPGGCETRAAGTLSGGNQQKVILARWLETHPKVLILDEPTKGIDVVAKAEFYRIITECAQQGMAVIVISSELPEIIGLSDRILVMRDGRISGELLRKDFSEEKILTYAMASEPEQKTKQEALA